MIASSRRCLTAGFMLGAAGDVKVVATPSVGATSLGFLIGKHTREDSIKFLHRLLKTLAVTDGRGSALKIELYPPIDSIGLLAKEQVCIGE